MRELILPTDCLVVVDDPSAPRPARASAADLVSLREGDTVPYARLALPRAPADLACDPSTPSVVAPPATEVP